jgi:tetratricopeptide (TPR) repeat protein
MVGGAAEVRLNLADGADARVLSDEGAAVVTLFPSPTADPRRDRGPQGREDPTPQGGEVRVQAAMSGPAAVLRFPWRAPLGAAVFRRGDGVWIVFDSPAALGLPSLSGLKGPDGRPLVRNARILSGRGYAALRLSVRPDIPVSAQAEGAQWIVTLGSAAAPNQTPDPVNVTVDQSETVGLAATVAGATGVFWLQDPVVGDRVAAVTALPPLKTLVQRRSFVGGALLPTAQGLAVEAVVDGLDVSTSRDVVRIGRRNGLSLASAAQDTHFGAAALGDPQPAAEPAVIDFANWSKVGPDGFNGRYAQLFDKAVREAGEHKAGKVQARMALARFLVGSELNFEAVGVLNLLARTDPGVLATAEFRGLRGAAKVMAGRYKDAIAEFSAPALAVDRSAALWRGYIAVRTGDLAGARQSFAMGRLALGGFSGRWKARLARAAAESELAAGDLRGASQTLDIATAASNGDEDETMANRLVMARVLESGGHVTEALNLYDAVGKARHGAVSAPAALRALQIRVAHNMVTPSQAAPELNTLRFRWRGDATELEVVRTLSRIELQQGRYRDALEVLRSAGKRLADLPAASAIQTDLSQAFRALFLEGRADGMQPIQALGLFYDFRDLTPIGADGDTMVRRLARRLVDVDLLGQAAELLKYQAEKRLDGVARADVATDLATIYLMDHKPEDALGAINASRTTVLPTWLNAQRRLVEARALMALGRTEHALEVLSQDKSPDVIALRAEAAWAGRDWARAAAAYDGLLGTRWKSPGALTPEEEGRLMRAGVAYSLAGDDAALTRLRSRYARLADGAKAREMLRVALSGMAAGDASPAAYGRAVAEVDSFAGWVATMKKKFLEKTDAQLARQGPAVRSDAVGGTPRRG